MRGRKKKALDVTVSKKPGRCISLSPEKRCLWQMCIRTIWRGALSLPTYSTPRALVLSGAKKSSAICISNVVQFDRNSVILISFWSLSALPPSRRGLQRCTHTHTHRGALQPHSGFSRPPAGHWTGGGVRGGRGVVFLWFLFVCTVAARTACSRL